MSDVRSVQLHFVQPPDNQHPACVLGLYLNDLYQLHILADQQTGKQLLDTIRSRVLNPTDWTVLTTHIQALPERTPARSLTLTGKAAVVIGRALHHLPRATCSHPAAELVPYETCCRIFSWKLPHPKRAEDGIIALQLHHNFHVHIFYSIEQGQRILDEYSACLDEKQKLTMPRQLRRSILPLQADRPAVEINGSYAQLITTALHLEVQLKHFIRLPP